MRNRTKLVLGFGLASAWLWAATPAFAQLGGGSTGGASSGGGGSSFGGGGGGGGGSGGGRGGGGGGGGNQANQGGSTQSGTIANDSILGSFQNAGGGRTTSVLSQTNLFSTTYLNPYQQGLLISNGQNFTPISNAGFGQAVFGTIMSGGGAGAGGFGGSTRSGFGTNAASMAGRSGTGMGFGGTSTGGMNSFGTGGATGRVGTTAGSFGAGLGGTTGMRSGSTGMGGAGMTFAGGNLGPSIGRTGPIIGSALHFNPPVRLEVEHRADLQSIVNRSITSINAPSGVNVGMNQGVVILRGNVATADEKRLVENMLRLHPGVREVRNELEVRGGNP
jgi:hypothetical protein